MGYDGTWMKIEYLHALKKMAMLKLIVDFGTMLIGAEGRETPAGERVKGDPTGAQRRGGSRTARGKRVPWNGNQQSSLTETKK
jgi:hypothetical protein